MYKRIIIVSCFLNITSIFASAPVSKQLQTISIFKKIENQGSTITKLETEITDLQNKISSLNNIIFALIKGQNDLLILVNHFDQHANEKTSSLVQNAVTNTVNANSFITNPIRQQKQPLIRRSSFTSANTNPQQ